MSSKLKEKKSAKTYIAQKLIVFVISLQTRKIRLRFWSFFSQTRVKNLVTMATAQVPGDQKVYQMICNRLTTTATAFQQSSANPF